MTDETTMPEETIEAPVEVAPMAEPMTPKMPAEEAPMAAPEMPTEESPTEPAPTEVPGE